MRRIRDALEADDRRSLRVACQDLVDRLTRGWQVPLLAVRVLAQSSFIRPQRDLTTPATAGRE
ncbi:MAG: hypothetical protein ACREX6_00780 [Casimicrobiaceae bacterium]